MKRIPGRFHPGEYIREEMKARGIGVVEMCTCHIGTLEAQFDPKVLGAILKGRHSVDREIGAKLHKALGVSADFWLNLQKAYDEGGKNEEAV